MKIIPNWRPFGKELQKQENAVPPQMQMKSFSDLMSNQDQKVTQEQLQQMLQQINKQAERLSKAMTVRELRQYKLLIKKFLEETARRGILLKDTRGWDRRGRTKRYKILDEIDKELLSLADELLESEQGRIDILNKIGEIRGMLINVLF